MRAPVLERLLACGAAPIAIDDWRRDAFAVVAAGAQPSVAVPSPAAAALHAAVGRVAEPWVCLASPVHLLAGMTHVTLPEEGLLQLEPAENAALAADFNRVFLGSGTRLLTGSGALFCVAERSFDVATREPGEVLGENVFAFQPTGADAARLRRLMSEMEMWLFDHPVNQARSVRQQPVLTGLWLWGGGATLAALPRLPGWTAGADPLFGAFGDRPAFEAADGGGVLVCAEQPGSAAWGLMEQRWLLPLTAALRAGRIGRIEFSCADRLVAVERAVNRRFWRRPRPWWEVFGLAGGAE